MTSEKDEFLAKLGPKEHAMRTLRDKSASYNVQQAALRNRLLTDDDLATIHRDSSYETHVREAAQFERKARNFNMSKWMKRVNVGE